jgi:hypothetical protein
MPCEIIEEGKAVEGKRLTVTIVSSKELSLF